MKLPSNKLKKNKLNYLKKFLIYLKNEVRDTNLFVWKRYTLYRDVIIPYYKMKAKKIQRKGRN